MPKRRSSRRSKYKFWIDFYLFLFIFNTQTHLDSLFAPSQSTYALSVPLFQSLDAFLSSSSARSGDPLSEEGGNNRLAILRSRSDPARLSSSSSSASVLSSDPIDVADAPEPLPIERSRTAPPAVPRDSEEEGTGDDASTSRPPLVPVLLPQAKHSFQPSTEAEPPASQQDTTSAAAAKRQRLMDLDLKGSNRKHSLARRLSERVLPDAAARVAPTPPVPVPVQNDHVNHHEHDGCADQGEDDAMDASIFKGTPPVFEIAEAVRRNTAEQHDGSVAPPPPPPPLLKRAQTAMSINVDVAALGDRLLRQKVCIVFFF